jgi:thymidylate synthase
LFGGDKAFCNKYIHSLGNLYTVEGFKFIILNSFLAPNLSRLVFCGTDINHVEGYIVKFFSSDEEDGENIRLNLAKCFDKSLTATPFSSGLQIVNIFYERFKNNYYIIDSLNNLKEFIVTEDNIEKMDFLNLEVYIPYVTTYKEVINDDGGEGTVFPSDESGYKIISPNLEKLWKMALKRVCYFGNVDSNSKWKQILNLVSVLERNNSSNNNPSDLKIVMGKLSSESDLEQYIQTIISDSHTTDINNTLSYTYGQRIHKHLPIIVAKLKKDKGTRQAYLSLWEECDYIHENPPCMVSLCFNIIDNKLCLNVVFRSHDIFKAYKMNIYGLTRLQDNVLEELGKGVVEIGNLTVISINAHIYANDYDKAKQTVSGLPRSIECKQDKYGYYVISSDGDIIKITHRNSIGNRILREKEWNVSKINNETFMKEAREWLGIFVSDISHAIYLGSELERAYILTVNKNKYIQS